MEHSSCVMKEEKYSSTYNMHSKHLNTCHEIIRKPLRLLVQGANPLRTNYILEVEHSYNVRLLFALLVGRLVFRKSYTMHLLKNFFIKYLLVYGLPFYHYIHFQHF